MQKNIAIKVQNITKTYRLYNQPIDRLKESLHPFKKKYHKEFHALNDVSFEIKKGETVGIIGRNGSGKSTLLKIITGVLTPSHGHVHVNGKISAILELGAGFNPEMTGLENIHLNSTINGLSVTEIKQRVHEIVEFSELDEFIHQPVKTYSSGMNARLAFGVAIHIDPDILIVDEALSVGDAAFQRKCFAKMEDIRSKGATVLFVSHSESSIVNLCSRAIWIHQGNYMIDGEPKIVTNLYMKHMQNTNLTRELLINELDTLQSNIPSKSEVKKSKLNTEFEEFYNPSLKSKSTIFYDENGATISNVKITNKSDKNVNVLLSEESYKVHFDVELHESLNDVRFGASIRDLKGVYYAGVAYELLKHSNVQMLTLGKYRITFDFDCLLTEGLFVLNVAILKDFTQHRINAHRIHDVILFKVIKKSKSWIEQSHVSLFKGYDLKCLS